MSYLLPKMAKSQSFNAVRNAWRMRWAYGEQSKEALAREVRYAVEKESRCIVLEEMEVFVQQRVEDRIQELFNLHILPLVDRVTELLKRYEG